MNKKIFFISLFLSLQGFLANFWFFIVDFKQRGANTFSYFLFDFIRAFHFRGLEYTYYKDEYGYGISLLTLFFYILFFTGTFIYLFSKGKEFRLLRFSFSLIILSLIINALPFRILRLTELSGLMAKDYILQY